MGKMETSLLSKGRMTIPKVIRDALGLKAGDKVIFEKTERGEYILKASEFTDIQGIEDRKAKDS